MPVRHATEQENGKEAEHTDELISSLLFLLSLQLHLLTLRKAIAAGKSLQPEPTAFQTQQLFSVVVVVVLVVVAWSLGDLHFLLPHQMMMSALFPAVVRLKITL